MKLLEIERKFSWNSANLNVLLANRGQPPFSSRPMVQSKLFRDTYYDLKNRLSSKGLWVRKRLLYDQPGQACNTSNGVWEAKQLMPGSSFVRSTYDETQDPSRIWQMINNCIPKCTGPDESFGLEKTCRFETHRRWFLADGKFKVVLDETDFGHSAGEVELIAEDANKAHAEIDVFLTRYAWFFDCSKPKGKLTAYFEKYPRHNPRAH